MSSTICTYYAVYTFLKMPVGSGKALRLRLHSASGVAEADWFESPKVSCFCSAAETRRCRRQAIIAGMFRTEFNSSRRSKSLVYVWQHPQIVTNATGWNGGAGALIVWTMTTVDGLYYLRDLDDELTVPMPAGSHEWQVIDLAHTKWAASSAMSAINLCAAGLARRLATHLEVNGATPPLKAGVFVELARKTATDTVEDFKRIFAPIMTPRR